jgi:hypothetical protein
MLEGARAQLVPLQPVEHAFTHFDLIITPLLARCSGQANPEPAGASSGAPPPQPTQWYRALEPARLGLPTPIRVLLEQLASTEAVQTPLFD